MATIDQLLKAAEMAEREGNKDDVVFFLSEAKKLRDQQRPETPAEVQKPKATLKGGLRTLAQGLTLGFGDEAEAYARSVFSGQDYEKILPEIRKNLAEFKKAKPLLATGLEIGGAVVPSLVPAGMVAQGARAAGLGATALRGAAAGATEGAIAGFGVGEGGLPQRAESAAMGAAIGGGLGAAAPLGFAVGSDVATRAFDGLGLSGPERAARLAERRVSKAIEREGMTPQTALAQMEEARSVGAEIMPADIGEATRGAAYAAQAVPSATRTGVLETLVERGAEQGPRIADVTAEKMQASGRFGLDYLDDIYEEAADNFRPLYQAADLPVDAAPFRKYADRKIFQQAFRAVQSRADTLGEEAIPDLTSALSGDTVPTSYLQKISQGLDRVINQNTDAVTGKLNDTAKDVLAVRNQFKQTLGQLNKAYKEADAQFADMMQLRRAYDVGDAFEKMDSQQFARKVKDMTAPEVEAMKVGMITRLRNITSGTDRTEYVQRIFGSPKRRNALAKAFPSPEAFADFEKYMNFEASMARTERRVLGGSDTQRNLMEMQEQGVDPATMLQLFTGGRGEAVRQVAGALGSRMQGIGAPVAEQMSDILFARGPQAQTLAMQRLTRQAAEDRARRQKIALQPELYGGILGASVGLQSEDIR
tara:strand:+ start:807 stop:2750 length:1944 start_codon:yes stop_codon:yes gene_type:complete